MGGRSGPSREEKRQMEEQQAELARMRLENETMARTNAERLAGMMNVRGGNRALLSEARINPEQGITTLGQSPRV